MNLVTNDTILLSLEFGRLCNLSRISFNHWPKLAKTITRSVESASISAEHSKGHAVVFTFVNVCCFNFYKIHLLNTRVLFESACFVCLR